MRSHRIIIFSILLGAIIALAGAGAALALTPACTQIDNTAIIAYSVAGVSQTSLSGSASFTVGNKVDVIVTTMDTSFMIVPPGAPATAMTFSVTNKGNATQKFDLTAIADPNGTTLFGGTDNFDATNVKIYVGGVLTGTIASLASDASATVTLVVDIPLSQHDGDIAVYALKATAGNTDNSALSQNIGQAIIGGVTACTGDVVFGDATGADDGARDAAHSSRAAIKVIAAYISVTKTSAAVYDPVNCSNVAYGPGFDKATCSFPPKAIPGAVIEYTIQIANSATGTATNVTATDTLDDNLVFYADGYAAGKGMQVTAPNLGVKDLTNAADGDEGTYDGGLKKVSVNNIIVQKDEFAFVKFRAMLN